MTTRYSKMRVGIIQTRGLGDIIIAAPIAQYLIAQGNEVHWPIDSTFLEAFRYAFPEINFIPVNPLESKPNTKEYFHLTPILELQKVNCSKIFCLYSHLTNHNPENIRYQQSLTFDMYKYAITNVPFKEKWNLTLRRNKKREDELFAMLNLSPSDSYSVIHEEGSDFKMEISKIISIKNIKIIRITNHTDNFLDWLGIIEAAENIYCVDSVFANLIEQLNLNNNKYLFLRSPNPFTPVFRSNWHFI